MSVTTKLIRIANEVSRLEKTAYDIPKALIKAVAPYLESGAVKTKNDLASNPSRDLAEFFVSDLSRAVVESAYRHWNEDDVDELDAYPEEINKALSEPDFPTVLRLQASDQITLRDITEAFKEGDMFNFFEFRRGALDEILDDGSVTVPLEKHLRKQTEWYLDRGENINEGGVLKWLEDNFHTEGYRFEVEDLSKSAGVKFLEMDGRGIQYEVYIDVDVEFWGEDE